MRLFVNAFIKLKTAVVTLIALFFLFPLPGFGSRPAVDNEKTTELLNIFQKYTLSLNNGVMFWFFNKSPQKEARDSIKKLVYIDYAILRTEVKNGMPAVFDSEINQIIIKTDSLIEFAKDIIEHLNTQKAYEDPSIYLETRCTFNHFANVSKQVNAEISKLLPEIQRLSEIERLTKETNKTYLKFGLIFACLFLIMSLAFLISINRSKKKITRQHDEIFSKNQIIEKQKALVEEKQIELMDSILYAKHLQEAILPPKEFVDKYIEQNFILYKPKDIVAGDFYWAEHSGDNFYIAAADSTGHGIPGAMVSVVCSNALNRAFKEFKIRETGKILDKARELILETFEKSVRDVNDGMDISLLCVNRQESKISWSGANNSLWYIEFGELKEIKPDKQPVGRTENKKLFTTHELSCTSGTVFYLFTDGLSDQFGGPKGKKFKHKQFSDLLLKICALKLHEQSDAINLAFENWKGNLEQVDDICIIGICV